MKQRALKRKPRILISAGPTVEPLDPVRYLSNRSEGVMGYEIALSCLRRGYKTTVVCGPTRVSPPPDAKIHAVETARQMQQKLKELLKTHDCLIMAAAVCDFRAKKVSPTKLKKTNKALYTIELVPTEDILSALKKYYGDTKLFVGFSLESRDTQKASIQKLRQKGLDLIVANPITKNGPFGQVKNDFYIVDSSCRPAPYRNISKSRVAQLLLDKVEGLWYGNSQTKRTK